MRFLYGILFWITLSFCFAVQASANAIYVYRNINSTESFDLQKSRRIFDGSSLVWEDGKNIVLLINELEYLNDQDFFEFAKVSKSQFLSRWRIKFFSGRALIPIQVKTPNFAFDTLKSNPSALYFSFKEYSESELGTDKNHLKMDKISY